ncbi:hypothetical protein T484DRAFT_1804538 [Baffinella frigidus]|nr:hypothetical protein T484DRAFT_1804538 [Cryptophyta sp. CCMP2293]
MGTRKAVTTDRLASASARRALKGGRARAGKEALKGLDVCQHSLAKHGIRSARQGEPTESLANLGICSVREGAGEAANNRRPGTEDAKEEGEKEMGAGEAANNRRPGTEEAKEEGEKEDEAAEEPAGREKILVLVRFLGTYLAKAMLDNRLISLPLSYPLFKLLTHEPLSLSDLRDVDPDKARHLEHLLGLAARKREADAILDPQHLLGLAARNCEADAILDPQRESDAIVDPQHLLGLAARNCKADAILDPQERERALGHLPDLNDYCLTMEFAPSSTMHGFAAHPLVPGGADVAVTLDNVEEYVERMSRFILHDGISAQEKSVAVTLVNVEESVAVS